jgi:hypothetical protein
MLQEALFPRMGMLCKAPTGTDLGTAVSATAANGHRKTCVTSLLLVLLVLLLCHAPVFVLGTSNKPVCIVRSRFESSTPGGPEGQQALCNALIDASLDQSEVFDCVRAHAWAPGRAWTGKGCCGWVRGCSAGPLWL